MTEPQIAFGIVWGIMSFWLGYCRGRVVEGRKWLKSYDDSGLGRG